MKKSVRHFASIAIGIYVGMIMAWTPDHPARETVTEVKEEILGFYAKYLSVPSSLSFIEDEHMQKEITIYNLSWDPESLEISSKGNIIYKPSALFRMTFVALGKRVKSRSGNPGHILDHTIPKGTKVEQVD